MEGLVPISWIRRLIPYVKDKGKLIIGLITY